MSKYIFLSHILNEDTPTYGNRNKFIIYKNSSIKKGDIANDSFIETTVHIGTHLDMPYHFYEDGQTITDFEDSFFIFENPLLLELSPKDLIIKDDLISILEKIDEKSAIDCLIVKTGICYKRSEDIFWKENYGFHPDVADYIRKNFPNVRIFGFDSISVSSFTNRMLGRKAHKAFLNPEKPILLLEDMDLTKITPNQTIEQVIIAPLRIENCDGLPCSVIAKVAND